MRRLLALLLAVTACSSRTPPSDYVPSASWAFAQPDTPLVAAHAMVATEHPISSQVGADIMRAGGNAIDAAVAVAFAHAVVNPRAGNIGGGGFLVYRAADGTAYALDFREKAPAAATHDMYLDSAGNLTSASSVGQKAAGVPGSVAGLWVMHQRFGHLPWKDLVAPAIALAQGGHVVDTTRAEFIAHARRLAQFPASAALFLPGGHPLAAGTLWRQPDLARTLQLIADSGANGFYRGRTADLIVAEMRRGGGIITKEDLAAYQPAWREPLRIDYRGWTVLSMPPSSSGGVTMAIMLNILEGWRTLPPTGSAALLHLETEAMRRAFTDRNRYLGDPDVVQMPLARLLSKDYAATLRRQIDPHHATPSSAMPPIVEGTETTHFSIVDSSGAAVSLTTTLNDSFGDAVVVTGAGFLLNDEMDDFAAKPGAPNDYGLIQGEQNAIAPGKRMLSAMTPAIVLNPAGRLELVVGAPGGPRIISAVTQVISNVIDHHMSLTEAIRAPRIHHQALPDSIRWEKDGVLPETRRALEAMGHHFNTHPGDNTTACDRELPTGASGCGNAVIEAIRVTPRGLEGVTDPRIPSRAAGY
jgi:gamma-glutamyltranspeptidase/glutathione hydrolase